MNITTVPCSACSAEIQMLRFKCCNCGSFDLCAPCSKRHIDLHPDHKHDSYLGSSQDWDAAANAVHNLWTRHGPFDGLAGYSLGACVAAALAAQVSFGEGRVFEGLKFMVLGAPRWLKFEMPFTPIDVPTLIVTGSGDWKIESERSLALAGHFTKPLIMQHDGGHIFLPRSYDALRAFAKVLTLAGMSVSVLPTQLLEEHRICCSCAQWTLDDEGQDDDASFYCSSCWRSWSSDASRGGTETCGACKKMLPISEGSPCGDSWYCSICWQEWRAIKRSRSH